MLNAYFITTVILLQLDPSVATKCLEFKLGSYYTSEMVLQSDAVTPGATIWGWGCAGARVSILTNPVTDKVDTRVDSRGWWSAVLQLAPGLFSIGNDQICKI